MSSLKRMCLSSALFLISIIFSVHLHAGGPMAEFEKMIKNETSYTGNIILKFNDGFVASRRFMGIRALVEQMGYSVGTQLSHVRTIANGAQLLKIGGSNSTNKGKINRLIKRLSQQRGVRYAVAEKLFWPLAVPNDPRWGEQWHYYEPTGGLNLPAAYDVEDGHGVVVAVIDTGYQPHSDLVDNVIPGYDFVSNRFRANDGNGRDADAQDPGDWVGFFDFFCFPFNFLPTNSSWHGTHVAGTIAAVTNNTVGVAGVAPSAKILPVRVLGKCGGTTSDIIDGIIWSSGGSVSGVPNNNNPADVINMSLGGSGSCDSATQDAINQARANGSTVVVAAGNSNASAGSYTPASCNGVITVAATDRNGAKAPYSNYGAVVDVAAPGGDSSGGSANGVLSTSNSGSRGPGNENYRFYQGTSMAAPHVAGVAALLKANNPSLSPDQVANKIMSSARSFPGSCNECGSGIVDAAAALTAP